jgi:hypothetical protein
MLLLIPFTKFAHAIFRTVALYIHALRPMPKAETKLAEVAGTG